MERLSGPSDLHCCPAHLPKAQAEGDITMRQSQLHQRSMAWHSSLHRPFICNPEAPRNFSPFYRSRNQDSMSGKALANSSMSNGRGGARTLVSSQQWPCPASQGKGGSMWDGGPLPGSASLGQGAHSRTGQTARFLGVGWRCPGSGQSCPGICASVGRDSTPAPPPQLGTRPGLKLRLQKLGRVRIRAGRDFSGR